jgi:hypothetical protein
VSGAFEYRSVKNIPGSQGQIFGRFEAADHDDAEILRMAKSADFLGFAQGAVQQSRHRIAVYAWGKARNLPDLWDRNLKTSTW